MKNSGEAKISLATTSAERQAIYRFRYQVYVEEMGRYQNVADHKRKIFSEDVDERSHLFYASIDGEVVATSRLTCGIDGGLSQRQIEQYQLAPFLEQIDPSLVAVGERAMVQPQLRGTTLFLDLLGESLGFVNEHRIELMFGASEAHLLSLYQSLGMRTYSQKNINSPEAGYLIPQVLVVEDVDYLRRLRSPLAEMARDFGDDRRIPAALENLLATGSAVLSRKLASGDSYWREVNEAMQAAEAERPAALDGLRKEAVERYLSKSNIIECEVDDVVVKKGGISRNLYLILDGTLEVKDGDRAVAVLAAGDVFGEMSFLLGKPRSMDVVAAVPGTRVLSLSESTLRSMIDDDPQSASVLLLNLSKMLCLRLLKMN